MAAVVVVVRDWPGNAKVYFHLLPRSFTPSPFTKPPVLAPFPYFLVIGRMYLLSYSTYFLFPFYCLIPLLSLYRSHRNDWVVIKRGERSVEMKEVVR